MEKRILCYSDFSNNAQNAIDYAIKLYEQQSCVFYILNAFHADKNASDIEALIPEPGNKIYEEAKKSSEVGLKKIIDTLNSNSKNTKHTFKSISIFNSLLYALKDTIKIKAINLLIIGAKSTLEIEEDKNIPTLDVLEYITECSILAIPGNYKFCELKKIVLPINYQEVLNKANFSEIFDIIKLHNSEINILHIKKENHLNNSQLECKKLLETIFKGFKFSSHTLERMNVNKGINLFIKNQHSNLIVYTEEISSYIGNELPRPLLKELENNLTLPVMVVNVII
ncbi:adenine nucleotide alpha hydrolase family protein [Lutibacter citreus]|uniref:hypothetical protein n=1 Tax=Lutibacter citreus TaxID=2138210 RepID=UPI000DBE2D90|nr:hypothetical protein [Lutibacter citreus]